VTDKNSLLAMLYNSLTQNAYKRYAPRE